MAKKKVVNNKDPEMVGTSAGLTISLGGFQSVRVDCWLVLPCGESGARDTYDDCFDYVQGKVIGEARKIHEANQKLKGTVGSTDRIKQSGRCLPK